MSYSDENNSNGMSRDLVEIQKIRKEKAAVEKIIKSYQKRSEELREKEEVLMKKMESVERGQYTWENMVEDPAKKDEYIVCDPLFELTKTVDPEEECKECILRLREEVLKKQYENFQLEKELEMKKEEHRQLELQCNQPECMDFGLEAPHFHGDRTDWMGENIEVLVCFLKNKYIYMADETKGAEYRANEDASPVNKDRVKTHDRDIFDRDFFTRQDHFPAIAMAMNMMKLSQMNANKPEPEDLRSVKESRRGEPERALLREKLQEKLGELLDEQQALVDLYMKAARAAKEKETEYRERIAELVEQTERDKQLMELFRNI